MIFLCNDGKSSCQFIGDIFIFFSQLFLIAIMNQLDVKMKEKANCSHTHAHTNFSRVGIMLIYVEERRKKNRKPITTHA